MRKLLHSGTSMARGLWKFSKVVAPVAALAALSSTAYSQVVLPFSEDFSGAGLTLTFQVSTSPVNGLTGTGYSWEFETSTTQGRARFAAGSAYYICGNGAATLDANPSGAFPDPVNFLTLELDMTTYIGASNIELAFNWMDHGDEPDANDRVWVRGSDTDPFIEIFNWEGAGAPIGQWQTSFFDIDDALTQNGQSFSTTTQIRWGQQDNFQSTSITASDGFTLDNVQITGGAPVDPDVSAVALLSVGGGGQTLSCSGSATGVNYVQDGLCAGDYDFEVIVTNNGTTPQSNIPVELVLDGVTYNGTVAGPLAPLQSDTIIITAPGLVGSTNGTLLLGAAYVNLTGDQNLANDTTDSLEITVYDNTPISQSITPALTIPAQTGTFTSSAFVCGVGVMDSCNRFECLEITDMSSTWTGFVTIDLISPSGTVLSMNNTGYGGTGDDFNDVKFTDNVTTPLSINGTAGGIIPGSYAPEDPFSTLWGESGDGEWTLVINNGSTLNSGVLEEWRIEFKNSNPSFGVAADTICDESFVLNPGSQFATYMWSPANNEASTFNATMSGTNTYSVTTTDAEGLCTSSASIDLSLGHQADLGPDQSLCQGESVTYDLGPAFATATWAGGGTPNGTELTVDAVGTYTVEATDTLLCVSRDTTFILEVFQVQPIDLGDDVAICDGEFTVLNADAGFVAYDWTDGTVGQTRIIVSTGNYNVVGTDANGCTSSDDVTVTVNQPPFLPIDLGSNQGADVFFKDPNETVNFSQFGTDNVWTITNPNAIFTTPTISVTVAIGGHVVTLNATDPATNCETDGTVVIESYPLGVDDLDENTAISLFPNPNNGLFTLQNNGDREVMAIQIVDVQGKVVLNRPNVVLENGSTYELDLTSQATGLYFVNLVRESSTEQIRVIIE